MTPSVDTDRIRRIMEESLPSGTSAAELFIESLAGVEIVLPAEGGAPSTGPPIRRRWEAGAHLRRFSEGRHESYVLDSPTPDSLEALARHPESIGPGWLKGSPGSDIPVEAPGGLWSGAFLKTAFDLIERWLGTIARDGASIALEARVQEVLVVSTQADAARDTRRYAEATISIGGERDTFSGVDLEDLAAKTAGGDGVAALPGRFERERIEAGPAPRGEMPVVFASPSGGFLLHEICGHLLEADHVVGGASPFAGARGEQIASELLTLADDGSIEAMRGSSLIDDEGVASRRTPLIMKGTLVGYLSDRRTAFATDGISTGNGRRQSYRDAPMPRMTNLVIDPGRTSAAEILHGTPRGLLVTRLGRGRVDPATGRFALAVERGFLLEEGNVGPPVRGAVLHGRAGDLLPRIDAVGDDPAPDPGAPRCIKEGQAVAFGILQPTLRVSSMLVSGTGR